jgi:hypothetical protein
VNFQTCSLSFTITKSIEIPSQIYVSSNFNSNRVICSPVSWSTFSEGNGFAEGVWYGVSYPVGISQGLTVNDETIGEVSWTSFSDTVETVTVANPSQGVTLGVYYRPGSETTSGGTILVNGIKYKRRVFVSTSKQGTLKYNPFVFSSSSAPITGVSYDCCDGTSNTNYGVLRAEARSQDSTTWAYPGGPSQGEPPDLQINWLAYPLNDIIGLSISLTTSGNSIGEWMVTKNETELTVSSGSTVYNISSTTTLSNAKTTLEATGYFTVTIGNTSPINGTVLSSVAQVRDLVAKVDFVSGSGSSNCVQLVLVPRTTPLAPSSTKSGITKPGLTGSTPGCPLDGFFFQKNKGYVDSKEGFYEFLSSPKSIKISLSDYRIATGSGHEWTWSDVGWNFWTTHVASGTCARSGWDYNQNPSVVSKPVFKSYEKFSGTTTQTESFVRCNCYKPGPDGCEPPYDPGGGGVNGTFGCLTGSVTGPKLFCPWPYPIHLNPWFPNTIGNYAPFFTVFNSSSSSVSIEPEKTYNSTVTAVGSINISLPT